MKSRIGDGAAGGTRVIISKDIGRTYAIFSAMEIYMPSTLNYGRQTIAELEINPGPHVAPKKKNVELSHICHVPSHY